MSSNTFFGEKVPSRNRIFSTNIKLLEEKLEQKGARKSIQSSSTSGWSWNKRSSQNTLIQVDSLRAKQHLIFSILFEWFETTLYVFILLLSLCHNKKADLWKLLASNCNKHSTLIKRKLNCQPEENEKFLVLFLLSKVLSMTLIEDVSIIFRHFKYFISISCVQLLRRGKSVRALIGKLNKFLKVCEFVYRRYEWKSWTHNPALLSFLFLFCGKSNESDRLT